MPVAESATSVDDIDGVHASDDRAAQPGVDPGADSRIRRRIVLGAGAGAVLIVLLGLGVTLLVAVLRQPSAPSYQRSAAFSPLEQRAVLAARQEVLKLTTLSAANADRQLKSLLGDATGSFRDNLAQIATPLKDAVIKQKVTTTGSVAPGAIGISSTDPATRKVTMLVAATQLVKNSAVPEGENRSYRLQVTIQKVGTRYLVADMEFVS